MKKALSLVLVFALLFCLIITTSADTIDNSSILPSIVQPAGCAYVIITSLSPGEVKFKYGWNNAKHFASPPVGYWIGVYHVTAEHYEWAYDNRVKPGLKKLKLRSLSTELISGDTYKINFFVRNSYGTDVTNVSVIELEFIAP